MKISKTSRVIIKRHQRKILLILIAFGVAVLFAGYLFSNREKKENKESKVNSEPVQEIQKTSDEKTEAGEPEIIIKESVLLEMPFTVQAPFANWKVHEESCEEAALLMYNYFLHNQTKFNGQSVIPQEGAGKDIVGMKNWQIKNYGKEPNLSMAHFAEFAKSYYNLNSKIISKITKDDIKKELSGGNPVIVPATTASLHNPYYPPRTDTYHYLLIKGYEADGIITNDPGTRRGEGYFYKWDTLSGALKAQQAYVDQGQDGIVLMKM